MDTGTNFTYIDAATQIDNLGDDIIVRQLLRLLATRSNLTIDVRQVPDWAAEVMGIGDLESTTALATTVTAHRSGSFTLPMMRRGLKARLGLTTDRTFLILKPGHIGGRYGVRQTIGRLGLLGLTGVCRVLGIGVVRLGFSVDDLKEPLLSIERLQSRLQTQYAPRDGVSMAYAESVGVRATGRSTDLAFTLGVATDPAPRDGVILSFAASTDGHLQDSYADLLAGFLRQLVDEMQCSGTDVRYCAQVVRDARFGDRVLARTSSVPRIAFERTAAGAGAVFDTYQAADVVLTNRLHSFLFALSQGAPAIVVTDPAMHGKIVGIVEQMGLPELLVDINGLDPATLLLHMDRVRADRHRILARVAEYFGEQSDRLHDLVDGWLGEPVGSGEPVAADARAA